MVFFCLFEVFADAECCFELYICNNKYIKLRKEVIKMKKLKNTIYSAIAILILGGAGVAHKEIPNIKALLGNKIETKFNEAVKGTTSSSSDSSFDSKVTESVASQGMPNEIKASLGNVKFNGYGAYVVNDNKTNLT